MNSSVYQSTLDTNVRPHVLQQIYSRMAEKKKKEEPMSNVNVQGGGTLRELVWTTSHKHH